jgi:hypothetical protein
MSTYYVDDGYEKYLVRAETPEEALIILELPEGDVGKVSKEGRDLIEWASKMFVDELTKADVEALKDFITGSKEYVCLG